MKNKMRHPNLIWLAASASLFLNLLTLYSSGKILAEDLPESTVNKFILTEPQVKPVVYPTPSLVPVSTPALASNEETAELTPRFYFSFEKGTKIQGDWKITGKVAGASAVEFYLLKRGSINPEYYVGSGRKYEEQKWAAVFRSRQFPNGEYEFFAKIKNIYGSYKSEKISVIIDNEIPSPTPALNLNNQPAALEANSSPTNIPATNTANTANNTAVANTTRTSTPTPTPSPESNPSSVIETVGTSKETKETSSSSEKIRAVYQKETAIKNNNALSAQEKEVLLTKLESEKKEIKKEFVSRQEAERILVKPESQMTSEEKEKAEKIKQQFKEDSDGDGLPDFEEERIGTDIFSADSDRDGYLDGDEVASGFDPMVSSQGNKNDKIVFEEPKDKGVVQPVYEVSHVSYENGKQTDFEQFESGGGEKGIKLKGRALPNSFVTLYIYSSGPVVVTVKADENGNWEYLLNKELEDGQHEVYAAVTDNTGKITAKSEPFSFVKTAQAVEKIEGPTSEKQTLVDKMSPLNKSQAKIAKFVLIFSFISLFLALASIALFVKHREFFKKKAEELKNNE